VALIEVMVSLVIFLVGVLGVIGLQAKSVQLTVQAEDRSRAALLANDLVSELWSRQAAVPDDALVNAWQQRVKAALPHAEASVAAAGGLVTVTIAWRGPYGGAKSSEPDRYVTQVALP
jgi:type IV pilus assembly protein PilV